MKFAEVNLQSTLSLSVIVASIEIGKIRPLVDSHVLALTAHRLLDKHATNPFGKIHISWGHLCLGSMFISSTLNKAVSKAAAPRGITSHSHCVPTRRLPQRLGLVSIKGHRGCNKNGCHPFFLIRRREWPLISTTLRWGFLCGSYKARPGRGGFWKYSGRTLLCGEIDWRSVSLLIKAISLSRRSILLCVKLSCPALVLALGLVIHWAALVHDCRCMMSSSELSPEPQPITTETNKHSEPAT